eukprot:1356549-Amphidinium_carterae.1
MNFANSNLGCNLTLRVSTPRSTGIPSGATSAPFVGRALVSFAPMQYDQHMQGNTHHPSKFNVKRVFSSCAGLECYQTVLGMVLAIHVCFSDFSASHPTQSIWRRGDLHHRTTHHMLDSDMLAMLNFDSRCAGDRCNFDW